MSDGLTIRTSVGSDRAAIMALCRSTLGWGDDPRFDRLFEWKHELNAFGRSYCWVAVDGDQVVGVRLFMQWEFIHHGHPVRAVRAVDTATHPDHQGRGIFTALTLHGLEHVAADGVGFVFNTPNDKSRPGYLKMGWNEVGRLSASVRFAGPGGVAAALRSRVPAELWSVPTTVGVPFEQWMEGHDHAWSNMDEARLGTNWNDARLRWRYSLPELGYRVTEHRGTALIFRLRHRGAATELVACDALGDRSPRSVDRAIGHAVRACRASYGLRLGQSALHRGMLPLPGEGPTLTWRGLAAAAHPPIGMWAVTMGDIELF
jgi:GNAT superfamily N-acetyltransferase